MGKVDTLWYPFLSEIRLDFLIEQHKVPQQYTTQNSYQLTLKLSYEKHFMEANIKQSSSLVF